MGGGGENDVPSFLAHFILGRVDLSSRLRQSRQLYKVGERETELLVFYGHYQDPTDSNSLSLSLCNHVGDDDDDDDAWAGGFGGRSPPRGLSRMRA